MNESGEVKRAVERLASIDVSGLSPTCKNCRFGQAGIREFAGREWFRYECSHPKMFNGDCEMITDGAIQEHADDLHFGPNFGCIHFEKKP